MAGEIKMYANAVFTNVGQGTVEDFKDKLTVAVLHDLQTANAQKKLTVITGFHGRPANDTLGSIGTFMAEFTKEEMGEVDKMVQQILPTAAVHIVQTKADFEALKIDALVTAGNVFFTWCDSDAYVGSKAKL